MPRTMPRPPDISAAPPVPTGFSLNAGACTGSVATPSPTTSPSRTASPTPTTTSPSPTPSPTPSQTGGGGTLPSSFRWSSSGVLMSPKSNSTHNLIAVKDPSVVRFNGTYYVLMSTVDSNGNYNMGRMVP